MPTQELPEPQRKEIFLALVDAQDHDLNVVESRQLIMKRFGLSEGQLRQIEREGMAYQWLPL